MSSTVWRLREAVRDVRKQQTALTQTKALFLVLYAASEETHSENQNCAQVRLGKSDNENTHEDC